MQKKYFLALASLAAAGVFLANSDFPLAEANESLQNTQAIDSSTYCGISPPSTQVDNFSELNFENFAPIYSGYDAGSTEVDPNPNLSINTDTPINGGANLQYSASATIPESWLIVSNAFYLGTQYTVSVDVRIDEGFLNQSSTVETGLIGAISAYNRYGGSPTGYGPDFTSTLDGLRLQHTVVGGVVKDYVILSIAANYNANSSSTGWTGGTNTEVLVTGGLIGNNVYTLSLTYGNSGITKATVVNKTANGATVASITPAVSKKTTASAIGMYVNLPALASTPTVNFSNVTVSSTSPYNVAANQYVRAPYPYFIVLNRYPDVPEFGGDWVGGATGFYDSVAKEYKMWYRQRTAGNRGIGYAYATSPDGVTWTKYNNGETIFIPTATTSWQSVEKISVIKVPVSSSISPSGYLYQAWYSILPQSSDGNGWRVAYAYSFDGINWTDKGIIDNSTYYKDPVVIQTVPGTYYMYVLYGNGQQGEGMRGSVLTCSSNCATTSIPTFATPGTTLWNNSDGHPGVFYAQNSKNYWLYQDNNPTMNNASSAYFNFCSSSGCQGAPNFKSIMSDSAVGLDDDLFDQAGSGVDYAFFMTNETGQLASDQNVLMYYQARHAYLNNPSVSWQDQQDGKIALAGKFTAYYVNLPATLTSSTRTYPTFPYPNAVGNYTACQVAQGFSSIGSPPSGTTFVVTVTSWDNICATGTTGCAWTVQNSGKATTTTLNFTSLVVGQKYLLSGGGNSLTGIASSTGITFTKVKVPASSTATTYTLTKD
ncbi:MAG: hypothetical protein ACHP9Y_02400 [Gammaproteobacteria bacterium]